MLSSQESPLISISQALHSPPDTICNFIAVVSHFDAPKRTNGTDYSQNIRVMDASLNDLGDALTVRIFGPTPESLPPINAVGDLVLMKSVRLSEYAGRKEVLLGRMGGDLIVFDPSEVPRLGQVDYQATQVEAEHLGHVCNWWKKSHSRLANSQKGVQIGRTTAPLSDWIITPRPTFYDFIGEVISVDAPTGFVVDCLVTDYSTSALLHPIDAYKLGFDDQEQPLQIGMRIACFDEHMDQIVACPNGTLVFMTNIQFKQVDGSTKGYLRGDRTSKKRKIFMIDENDPRVQELLQRRAMIRGIPYQPPRQFDIYQEQVDPNGGTKWDSSLQSVSGLQSAQGQTSWSRNNGFQVSQTMFNPSAAMGHSNDVTMKPSWVPEPSIPSQFIPQSITSSPMPTGESSRQIKHWKDASSNALNEFDEVFKNDVEFERLIVLQQEESAPEAPLTSTFPKQKELTMRFLDVELPLSVSSLHSVLECTKFPNEHLIKGRIVAHTPKHYQSFSRAFCEECQETYVSRYLFRLIGNTDVHRQVWQSVPSVELPLKMPSIRLRLGCSLNLDMVIYRFLWRDVLQKRFWVLNLATCTRMVKFVR
jgi:hypothetical protein